MNTHLEEKEIRFTAKNSYSTLNQLTNETENIWFVCHGMGYLSRYFLKYFKDLDPIKNYIVAPQAPSKYYQQPKMHVGANWLTRDNTIMGMETIINYFDAVFKAESLDQAPNLVILGYSQGVSVAMRYLAKRQIECQHLILHSGGIPKELKASDFDYMNDKTKVSLVYGTEDEYLNEDRMTEELSRAKELFDQKLSVEPFEGRHVVNVSFIKNLL